MSSENAGPLKGIRIIELGSIGPGPFAAMMLADNGAEVIRIERPGEWNPRDVLLRSRKVLKLNLKDADDIIKLRELLKSADAMIEGMRPGTLERLGLGPDVLLADNPALVIGRMTGWGQTGPYSAYAGHDINYIALSGALHATGPKERPTAPPAMLGDFGGGGMLMAFAVTSAILNARSTGEGQVIDCAMVDGSALLMSAFYGGYASGAWKDARGENMIDGGAHFYGAFETADGKFVTIGSIEPQFYSLLLETLGIDTDPDFADQLDESRWSHLKERIAKIIKTKSQSEWCAIMEHTDICFAPVLGLEDAPKHPHAVARNAFVDVDGITQPAPGPRYSATPLETPQLPREVRFEDL